MENKNITSKELVLLRSIADSEYQDGGDPVGNAIWLDYVVDSKSRGGVLSSLIKKKLVEVTIIPISESSNASNGISDSTVALTAAGVAALKS